MGVFSGLSQSAAKALGGDRFSLVNLLPTTILVGYVTTLSAAGAYTSRNASLGLLVARIDKAPAWLALAAFGIFVGGVLVRPFQIALVQLLEGYWSGPTLVEFGEALAEERHRRRLDTAQFLSMIRMPQRPSSAAFAEVAMYARRKRRAKQIVTRAERITMRYPRPVVRLDPHGRIAEVDDRLMPTMLGNILRDGEDESGRRYGFELAVVAPRLYPHLSPKLDQAISQQLDLLDTTSALCVCMTLATLASLPLLARLDAWSLAPLMTMMLIAVAYRGALRVAVGHGELLATAFDLHRFDMLSALHLKLPMNPAEEQTQNEALSNFLGSKGLLAKDSLARATYEHIRPDNVQPPPSRGSGSGNGNGAT